MWHDGDRNLEPESYVPADDEEGWQALRDAVGDL
jgi:hypothetical protein